MPNEVSTESLQEGRPYRLHVEPGLIVEGTVVRIDKKDRLLLRLDPQWCICSSRRCLRLRRSGIRWAEEL